VIPLIHQVDIGDYRKVTFFTFKDGLGHFVSFANSLGKISLIISTVKFAVPPQHACDDRPYDYHGIDVLFKPVHLVSSWNGEAEARPSFVVCMFSSSFFRLFKKSKH
jgi:hypothetical protein